MSNQKSSGDQKTVDLTSKITALLQELDKLTSISDERDLEISRLRRETEEQTKKNKSLNEKIMEYQKTNEKQRKDMAGLQEIKADLER